MKVYVSNRCNKDKIQYGCTVTDKTGKIVFQDALTNNEDKGASKNALLGLQWALKRVRSQLDTGSITLDSTHLHLYIKNKNIIRWLEQETSPKDHLNEYTDLELQLSFYPYPLKMEASREVMNMVKYTSIHDLGVSKNSKESNMKNMFQFS